MDPQDFGYGVFLFKYDSDYDASRFGADLANFKAKRRDLEVTAIAPIVVGPRGIFTARTEGFWVNCNRIVR